MQAMEIMEINDSPPAAAEAVPEAKDTIRRGLAASDLPAPSDTQRNTLGLILLLQRFLYSTPYMLNLLFCWWDF